MNCTVVYMIFTEGLVNSQGMQYHDRPVFNVSVLSIAVTTLLAELDV